MSDPSLCAKFYRPPEQLPPHASLHIRCHILMARFNRLLNVNWQEWRYHQTLQRRIPADLLSAFPERMGSIFSAAHGWGIVESLILNADGSPAKKLYCELPRIADPVLRLQLYHDAERLLNRFEEYDVHFFDLPNLLLQWTGSNTYRLRVADLEPYGKGVLACLTVCRFFSRLKLRRRSKRYLARLRQSLFVPEAAPAPACAGSRLFARLAGLI